MHETERQNCFPVMGKENAGNQVFKSDTTTLYLGLSYISLCNQERFGCILHRSIWHLYFSRIWKCLFQSMV